MEIIIFIAISLLFLFIVLSHWLTTKQIKKQANEEYKLICRIIEQHFWSQRRERKLMKYYPNKK